MGTLFCYLGIYTMELCPFWCIHCPTNGSTSLHKTCVCDKNLLIMAKGKYVVVLLRSLAGTGHKHIVKRPRLAEPVELIKFDPLVQQEVLYREEKKIKTLKPKWN